MKILAFSDLHRDAAATQHLVATSAGADALVVAGDFSTQVAGVEDTLDLLSRSAVPVVLVHGNHDAPAEIRALCEQHTRLHYLHGTTAIIGGNTFFGLGGEIPSRNAFVWNTSETEERAAEMLDACPEGAVVITHTPPFGVADLQKNGDHEGSKAVRDIISATNPKLLLCGHIHHARGTSGRRGSTWVQNLGPTANWFEI